MSRRVRWWAVTSCLLWVVPAQAAEGDVDGFAAGGARAYAGCKPCALAMLGAGYGVSEAFGLRLVGGFWAPLSAPDGRGYALGAGVFYRYDVIRWVPEATLDLSYFRTLQGGRSDSLEGHGLGASLGLSMEYLLSPRIGMGPLAQGHVVFGAEPTWAPLLDIGLRLRYRLAP